MQNLQGKFDGEEKRILTLELQGGRKVGLLQEVRGLLQQQQSSTQNNNEELHRGTNMASRELVATNSSLKLPYGMGFGNPVWVEEILKEILSILRNIKAHAMKAKGLPATQQPSHPRDRMSPKPPMDPLLLNPQWGGSNSNTTQTVPEPDEGDPPLIRSKPRRSRCHGFFQYFD
ncbi:hypothetical protein PIB30_078802 [Stylosanthes scabra]|uniref:Uncharacterized protein n=1 Tax=Stylosanthes scabra TaxID=79078 RepID=A0ABU6TRM2_9FABA|nr:hypothetical protein [Stylosanthes scabra]